MTGIWLLPGILLLAFGQLLFHRGILSAVPSDGRRKFPAFARVLTASVPGILLISFAAAQSQSTFLVTAAVSFSGCNLLLTGGLYAMPKPYQSDRILLVREYPAVILTLAYLVFASWGVFAEGHPEVVLGRGSGIFFLVLAGAEALIMAASAMKGYPTEPANGKRNIILLLLISAIGFCLLAGSTVFTVWGCRGISAETGVWPAFMGFIAGGPVLAVLTAPCMAHLRENGKRFVCMGYFGTAAFAGTFGLGIACLFFGVHMNVITAGFALAALAAMICYGLVLFFAKRVGRGTGVCLLLAYLILFCLFFRAFTTGML